jgi:hypothetical protein
MQDAIFRSMAIISDTHNGTKYYLVKPNIIMWGNVIMGINCYQVIALGYHVRLNISCWTKCYMWSYTVIMWSKFYHVEAYIIIWDQMLSCGTICYHFVIIWCYHVMLSCWMITSPFLLFLKIELSPSTNRGKTELRDGKRRYIVLPEFAEMLSRGAGKTTKGCQLFK